MDEIDRRYMRSLCEAVHRDIGLMVAYFTPELDRDHFEQYKAIADENFLSDMRKIEQTYKREREIGNE